LANIAPAAVGGDGNAEAVAGMVHDAHAAHRAAAKAADVEHIILAEVIDSPSNAHR
jgi:hypothetical protein